MVKKNSLLLLLLLSLQALVFAQEIHTPAEILKILEESELTYMIEQLKEQIEPVDRSDDVNLNNFYRKEGKGEITSHKYVLKEEAEAYASKAEEYFRKGKVKQAREMYLKVLEEDPEYYKVITYIGQTHGIEKDFDKAIKWYKKAIKSNYIDYMAHWFLADAYKEKGRLNDAVKEITIALVLNRNNPRIQKSFNMIYESKKLKTPEWAFTPQMKLDSVGPNKVTLAYGGDWLGYALAKAVWKFEPGYRASMGVKKNTFSTTEEREALAGLVVTFDKKKLKKNPEFKALKNAIDNKMINEYIFYEILLPQFPFVAYQLPAEFIEEIAQYVLKVRGEE